MTTESNLRDASNALARAVTQRDKIAAAITNATPADEAADQSEIAALRASYENIAADVVLGAATGADAAAAQKLLNEALGKQEARIKLAQSALALRAGLERKLSDADGAVLNAEEHLKAAEEQWLKAALSAADAEYVECASKIDQALGKIEACRALLVPRGTSSWGQKLQDVNLVAAGPVSMAACLQNNPGVQSGWNHRIHRAPNSTSDAVAAVKSEMAAAAQNQGVISRVREAIARSVAA